MTLRKTKFELITFVIQFGPDYSCRDNREIQETVPWIKLLGGLDAYIKSWADRGHKVVAISH